MIDDTEYGKPNSLLITNAILIDGKGTVSNELQSIYIDKGEIVEVGRNITVDEVPTIDAAGATVMPGLIDAHVHLQSVPGAVFRKDDAETLQQYRYRQLRAYLACGVTTVLDNAIAAPMLREFQDYLSAGGVGPRLYALAPAFYTPNGYLDHDMLTAYWGPQWPPVDSAEGIKALFDEYEGMDNIVGVKTMLETGFGKSKVWPIHSPEVRQIIVDEASKRNLPIYIHAYKEREQAVGLEMGVHTFVHSGFLFNQPKKDFLEQMQAKGTYVTTTLSCTLEQMLVNFETERLDDEFLRLTVPAELIETARNLQAWDEYYEMFFQLSSPKWLPSIVLKTIAKMMDIEKMIRSSLVNASKAVVKMHDSGIPIVVGTDASSWPAFLSFFHGPSTIREMELLGDAGIPPMDVISAATRVPSEMMGLEGLIGTVEVGKRADLIIVRDDPLESLSALKSLLWTVKDGEARSPGEWMAKAV